MEHVQHRHRGWWLKGRRDVVVFDAFLVERFLPTERRARRDGCPIGVSVGVTWAVSASRISFFLPDGLFGHGLSL